MKKKVKDVKKGEIVIIAGKECTVESIEMSDIGKHGKRKCRLEVKTDKNEKVVIIRPEDYPIETK